MKSIGIIGNGFVGSAVAADRDWETM